MHRGFLVGLVMGLGLLLVPVDIAAQFSTNFPGIPRGSLQGGQGRFEMDVWRALDDSGADDVTGYGLRMGFGRSWRVGTSFEWGFDVSLAQGGWIEFPENSTDESTHLFTGAVAYSPRIGVKWRPIAMVDPDGYGFEVALGAGYRPAMTAGATFLKQDSSFLGGLAGDDPEAGAGEVPDLTTLMIAGSYRAPDFELDAAIVSETAGDIPDEGSLVPVYDGVSLRAGGKYRLTAGFAVGAAFWSGGSPPWGDRIPLGLGDAEEVKFGVMLSFGRFVGKWTDLMIYSPSGDFSKGIGIHFSAR